MSLLSYSTHIGDGYLLFIKYFKVFDIFHSIIIYLLAYITVIYIFRIIFVILVWLYRDIFLYFKNHNPLERWRALSGLLFLLPIIFSLHVWFYYDLEDTNFQFIKRFCLIKKFNVDFVIGLDGISVCFILLTAFIMMLCWFAGLQIRTHYKEFIFCLILIELFLILSFIMLDLFFFYVVFESVLIPMFVIIGFWGSRERKIRAAYYFFLYTLFGSLFMLFGILYIYTITGTTDIEVLLASRFTANQQYKLWFCFFIPFAIKIPMFPFHIWLPEAHVEAPTVGSMILASLLLKLGGYGFLRFTIPMFPLASIYYRPLVYSLAVVSVIYASLVTISQIDLKRIIAYSSVAHMNLIVLGLFSYSQQGLDGAIYLMVGHGIVSTALFFCVGVLYDRHHTRLLQYYGGLAQVMPIYAMFLFFFTLANMGFPGTSNFIGELLILVGIFEKNTIIMIFAGTGIIFSAIYSIWLYNRIIFGSLKLQYFTYDSFQNFIDLSFMEKFILTCLTLQMFALGLHSNIITDLTRTPVSSILLSVC